MKNDLIISICTSSTSQETNRFPVNICHSSSVPSPEGMDSARVRAMDHFNLSVLKNGRKHPVGGGGIYHFS